MRIVITGAGAKSFLGWHVRKAFDSYEKAEPGKYQVTYIGSEYDLRHRTNVRRLFLTTKPDIVVHMAAKCGGILANKNSPADFISDNTYMSLNMYSIAIEMCLKRLYTLGSVCSYPKFCPVPFRESDLFNGYPEETNAPYGQAKRTLLMLGQTYRVQYGISGAHLIPVNMYGENDHFDLINSHVIPALINKFVNAKENNLPSVSVWGTGDATREFLYAGDCASAIVRAVVTNLDTPEPINIGTGKDISIKDLAYLLRKIIGFKGDIVFTGEVSDGQPERRLDVSKAKEIIGFEASTSLEVGLRKTIDWYMQNR